MLFCALLTAVSVGVPASHRVQLDVPAIKEGAVDIDCESEPGRSCQFRSGPSSMDPAVVDTWYDSLLEYTKRKRSELSQLPLGDFSAYDNKDIEWAKTSFVQPQVMVHDRYLYDKSTGQWTVDKYLDDLVARYGGVDAVLLWQGYPNIGVDDRNQYDLLRSLPGGLDGVKEAVAKFHSRGVKVFWPYFLWDSGTRNEGAAQYESLVKWIVETDSDGINGDTCDGLNATWWEEGIKRGKAVALETQSMGSGREGHDAGWQNITTNVMSWGEGWPYSDAPLISAYKAIEPRHMVQITERFAENRTNGLQHAFFNGVGYETWENIWNMFNKITARDSEAIRRIATIYRAYGYVVMSADSWRPFTPALVRGRDVPTGSNGVYASSFIKGAETVYTVVNRYTSDATKVLLSVNCARGLRNQRYFDLYRGREFSAGESVCSMETGMAELSFQVEGLGFGAILVLDTSGDNPPTPPPDSFLQTMRTMTSAELRSFSTVREFLPQTMVPTPRTTPAVPAGGLPGMVAPDTQSQPYMFTAAGNIQQGDGLPTIVDVQFPWESSPRRNHNQLLELTPYWIDTNLVTNLDYATYLAASGYEPRDKHNWLKHWLSPPAGVPPGWESKPLQWVSRSDAVAYCSFYNKRLPHTWEWQHAAQGFDNRKHPWGNEDPDDSRVPPLSTARDYPVPDDVGTHPTGASPYGVLDMVGSLFQWTDEFVDEHSSMIVVRGGSNYVPHEAARYYFPRPANLNTHNTLLSMSDSMDRSAGIGFRCAADGETGGGAAPLCAWTLCGTFTVLATGSEVDLTRLGSKGWVHYGYDAALDVVRKTGGGGRSVGVTILSASRAEGIAPSLFVPVLFPGFPVVNYRWTDDGDSPQSGFTARGIFIPSSYVPTRKGSGSGDGFRITVTPPTTVTVPGGRYTVRVYAGVYGGSGTLTATTSGGDNVYTETVDAGGSGATVKGVFEINVIAVDGWPISISWVVSKVDQDPTALLSPHVSLFAVTLA